MNKQVLTKTFSFSKCLLLFVLSIGLVFTGCKEDYDDDIKNLQDQITGLKAATDKIATLETGLKQAQDAATAAKTSADKAIADAGTASAAAKTAQEEAAKALEIAENSGSAAAIATAQAAADAAKGVADQALAEAKKAAEDAVRLANDAREAAIAATQAELDALKDRVASLEGPGMSEEDMQKIVDEVLAQLPPLEDKVGKILGGRLTSIEFIPESHINGIAAIHLYSMGYVPQSFVVHDELQHTTAGAGGYVTLSSVDQKIRFEMNPRVGVKIENLGIPFFKCIVSENDMTRAVSENNAGINSPIAPVEGSATINANGEYEISVRKTVNQDINREYLNAAETVEKFYMAAITVPLAPSVYTDAETESVNGGAEGPTVRSEYVRLAEKVVTPFIKQRNSVHEAGTSHNVYDPGANGDYPALNEVWVNTAETDPILQNRWIHFHDSTSLYNSDLEELVDYKIHWNATTNLHDFVDVCIVEEDHTSLVDYKSYGLAYRFYLASAPYNKGLNNTDQQRFARLESPESGLLTSKVYDYEGTGGDPTRTALDREPIIRAELRDTVNNNLVAARYIKLKFSEVAEARYLGEFTFPDQIVTCMNTELTFGTQDMNERVYRVVEKEYGLSKEEFHAIYTGLNIVQMTQDGVNITEQNIAAQATATTPIVREDITRSVYIGRNAPTTDYALQGLPDSDGTTSYNLLWTMTPSAIGQLKQVNPNAIDGYESTYKLTFEFTSVTSANITMDFIVKIKAPLQSFKYQGTFWDEAGQPSQPWASGVFKVNPIVYDTPRDGRAPLLDDNSHIETDLMNVFLSPVTDIKPANLAQFIQYIRGCADVRFVFDQNRFNSYTHLNGYTTTSKGVELWSGTPGTATRDTYGRYNYIQESNMAASISNKFGASATQNITNLPWDYNETLGIGTGDAGAAGVDSARAIIRLHERNTLDANNGKSVLGTQPAIDLIGKKVPVNLVVEYNSYNVIPVQKYEVIIKDPLTMDGQISGEFVDATVNGSYLDAQEGLTFRDWNNYKVANTPSDATLTNPKDRYTLDMWEYYVVNTVIYDVANIKTNLQWDASGTVMVPTPGYTQGRVPSVVSVQQVINYDPVTGQYETTDSNPELLGYFNANGTPVNLDYEMFIPVRVNYKWGTVSKEAVKVNVVKAAGTPGN